MPKCRELVLLGPQMLKVLPLGCVDEKGQKPIDKFKLLLADIERLVKLDAPVEVVLELLRVARLDMLEAPVVEVLD